MRFIFFTLIIANVALAGWWSVVGDQTARPRPSIPRETVSLVDVEPLKLLQEVDRLSGAPRELPSPLLEAAPRSCRMLGPVADQDAAVQLAAQLTSFGFSADVQPVEHVIGQAHWLYLPPEESPEATSARQSLLQARGVDGFVVTEGELADHIALGVFGDADLLEVRLGEMLRRGLAPRVATFDQTQTEYWILVIPGPSHLITGSSWRSALAADISLQEKEIFCLDVASR